jgi:hypothetical protein
MGKQVERPEHYTDLPANPAQSCARAIKRGTANTALPFVDGFQCVDTTQQCAFPELLGPHNTKTSPTLTVRLNFLRTCSTPNPLSTFSA